MYSNLRNYKPPESSDESSSLGVESDLEEQMDAEQKAKLKAEKAKAKAERKIYEFHNMPKLYPFRADPYYVPRNMNPFFSPNICQDIIYNPLPMIPKIKKWIEEVKEEAVEEVKEEDYDS